MKNRLVALTLYVFCAFGSAQALAHHSFSAEFDADKTVELQGIVLKVEWTNPHTYIYIEVVSDLGEYQEWALEMGSPNGLARRGWTRDTLAIGEEIKVRGTLARDGSNKANAQVVVIAQSCQRLFAGTSQRDFNESSSQSDPDSCEL